MCVAKGPRQGMGAGPTAGPLGAVHAVGLEGPRQGLGQASAGGPSSADRAVGLGDRQNTGGSRRRARWFSSRIVTGCGRFADLLCSRRSQPHLVRSTALTSGRPGVPRRNRSRIVTLREKERSGADRSSKRAQLTRCERVSCAEFTRCAACAPQTTGSPSPRPHPCISSPSPSARTAPASLADGPGRVCGG